jgi:hypothetical protein
LCRDPGVDLRINPGARSANLYLIRKFSGFYQMGIPVDRDHPFRFVVTGDSGGS